MQALWEVLPWLIAMVILIGCSAFFSASEAALFYLRGKDRRKMVVGSSSEQTAAHLLEDSERLLSAILFWNLVTNVAYFAIVSIVGLQLEQYPTGSQSLRFTFTLVSLLLIILCSEMLPKSLAVLQARRLSSALAMPLAVAVRVLDPLMPILRTTNLLSRRLLWPGFQAETNLEVSDLERAIELSTSDAQLVEQEQTVLRNIVSLSDIRADEWMSPRTRLTLYRPPIRLSEVSLDGIPHGYIMVTRGNDDEIDAAVPLENLSEINTDHLERHAESIVYAPWCSTVSDVLEQLQRSDRSTAAVVNEHGETIGVMTREDILGSVFSRRPSRSERLLNREPIEQIEPRLWRVTGLTNIRQLAEYFQAELPSSHNVTVAGIVQETLQRIPNEGDECHWGPFRFKALFAEPDGPMVFELVESTTTEGIG